MAPTLDRAEARRLVDTYSDLILRLSYTYLKRDVYKRQKLAMCRFRRHGH